MSNEESAAEVVLRAIFGHAHEFGELFPEGAGDVALFESAVVTIFVVSGGDVDFEVVVFEALVEAGPVFFGLLSYLFGIVPPPCIHDIAGVEIEIRALFFEVFEEPIKRAFPSRLGIADVPIKDVRYAGESNFCFLFLGLKGKAAEESADD